MRVRLSDQIWLRAAGVIEGPEKQTKLEGLVRFLAKRAAEADFLAEVAEDVENRSQDKKFEKDL